MRFTSEEALDAHNDGEPITMTALAAQVQIEQHGASFEEFVNERGFAATAMTDNANLFDAWTVLEWLGY